eukprot:8568005-Prorocentrum_lima.AAC.1
MFCDLEVIAFVLEGILAERIGAAARLRKTYAIALAAVKQDGMLLRHIYIPFGTCEKRPRRTSA